MGSLASAHAHDDPSSPCADGRVVANQPFNNSHIGPTKRGERTGCRYANLNFSEPSFSIVLTISSPAFNHTCLSLGYPRMTPWGVPDQMMSPGSRRSKTFPTGRVGSRVCENAKVACSEERGIFGAATYSESSKARTETRLRCCPSRPVLACHLSFLRAAPANRK